MYRQYSMRRLTSGIENEKPLANSVIRKNKSIRVLFGFLQRDWCSDAAKGSALRSDTNPVKKKVMLNVALEFDLSGWP